MYFICIMMTLPAIYSGYMYAGIVGGWTLGVMVTQAWAVPLLDSYHDLVQRSLNAYKSVL